MMRFREFKKWYIDRVCDGTLKLTTAIICINIIEDVQSHIFWKREQIWKKKYEKLVFDKIIIGAVNNDKSDIAIKLLKACQELIWNGI